MREKDVEIALEENYRAKPLSRAALVQEQMTTDVVAKIESAAIQHDLTVEAQPLFTKLESALEVKLVSLMQTCKNTD